MRRRTIIAAVTVAIAGASAIVFLDRNHPPEQEEPTETASGIIPSNPTGGTLWDSASTLWSQGRFEEAAAAFASGETSNPRDAAWPQALAECLAMLGKHQETLEALQRCERIAPLSDEAKNRRRLSQIEIGFGKAGVGDPWTARQLADAVLEVFPDDSLALLLKGYSWAMEGALPSAEKVLTSLVADHPGQKDAYPLLIQCAFRRGSASEAKRWIEALGGLDPRYPGLALLREQASQLESGRGAFNSRLRVTCDGSCPLGIEQEILQAAERSWTSLSHDLGRAPANPVSIRIADNGSMPTEWAAAVFDGQVRIPLEVAEQPDRRDPVLRHELAHAFLVDISGGRIPLWLNEGLAQWLEGSRPNDLPDARTASWLDGLPSRQQFMDLPADDARLAYTYSLAVTNELMTLHGSIPVVRYLELLAGGTPDSLCFRQTFGRSYRDLSGRIRARM